MIRRVIFLIILGLALTALAAVAVDSHNDKETISLSDK